MALRLFGTSLAGTTTGGTGVKNGVTAPIDGTAAPRARFLTHICPGNVHRLTLPHFRRGRAHLCRTCVGAGSTSALALWPQLA